MAFKKTLALFICFISFKALAIESVNCPLGVSSVNEQQLATLFADLKNLDDIPYKYVVDGCDVRAYLGAKELLEKRGITSFRVNFETYPGMYLETPYTFEQGVEFSKHSALAVCVNNNPIILDVSFFEKPVTFHEFYTALIDPNFIDKEDVRYYTSSMYNLNPEENRSRTSFDRSLVSCANKIAKRFKKEQRKIERGQLPYGVGRSKEVLRMGICD